MTWVLIGLNSVRGFSLCFRSYYICLFVLLSFALLFLLTLFVKFFFLSRVLKHKSVPFFFILDSQLCKRILRYLLIFAHENCFASAVTWKCSLVVLWY